MEILATEDNINVGTNMIKTECIEMGISMCTVLTLSATNFLGTHGVTEIGSFSSDVRFSGTILTSAKRRFHSL